MATRSTLLLGGLAAAGLLGGALVLFSWSIDETRFERPDAGFDRLTARIDGLPGVAVDGAQRWVEAPVFAPARSSIGVELDPAGLPEVLDAACTSAYPDAVDWSLRVRTVGGSLTVHGSATGSGAAAGSCPDFGLDAAALVGLLDRSPLSLDLRAEVGADGRLALIVPAEDPGGLSALLPLVGRAKELREAAGTAADRPIEINSSLLALVVRPGERERYADLLSALVEEHGVTTYWADGGGTASDRVAPVQITAPEREHAAIEGRLRTSGLFPADAPIRFLPPDPVAPDAAAPASGALPATR